MIKLFFVGIGGFLGSCLRYILSGWVHEVLDNPWYPFGTFAVNIMGCFFIGFFCGLVENKGFFSSPTRLFLLVGFLGGFTTFSTFSYETFSLLQDAKIIAAFCNITFHVFFGLLAVFVGYGVTNFL